MDVNYGKVRYPLSSRAQGRIEQLVRRFGVAATEVALQTSPTPETVGRIQGHLPEIVKAIASDPNISTLEASSWPDFLSEAAVCAEMGSFERMLMIEGLGASGSLPSVRLIAALAPMLTAHGHLLRLGFTAPKLVIFQATALGSLVNGIDKHRAEAVAHATLDFVGGYIRRFHRDSWLSAHLMTDDFESMRRLLCEIIHPLAERMPISDAMRRLSRERCSPVDAMKYGIAHAFQLQALVPRGDAYPSVFGPRCSLPRAQNVLAYGGIAERLFLDVISAAKTQADPMLFDVVPKMHVISRLGRKPAYAPFPDEPRIGVNISADDLVELAKDGRVRNDWLAIQAYHADHIEDLLDFINSGGPEWTLS